MSLALYVILASSRAPELPAWNSAMASAHIPVAFEPGPSLKEHVGFVPARLRQKRAGLYFMLESYSELVENYPVVGHTPVDSPIVYSLGYGGPVDECAVAFLSAFALVSTFKGIAFDPESGTVLTSAQLRAAGEECLRKSQ